MRMYPQKLEGDLKRNVYLGFALFLLVAVGAGCANTRKTTKTTTTETTISSPVEGGNKGYLKHTNVEVTQKSETTTTSTTETKGQRQGILGGTLHAIGWVIALPFRIVGHVIGWIF